MVLPNTDQVQSAKLRDLYIAFKRTPGLELRLVSNDK